MPFVHKAVSARELIDRILLACLAAVVFALCMLATAPAAAQSTLGTSPGQVERSQLEPNQLEGDQWLELLHWAARLTRRTVPEDLELPVVMALSAEQINQRVCPDTPERCRTIAAAYGIEHQDIIYRDTLDLSRLHDRSYLLHEFVHFLQHRDQREAVNASCQQILANERQAYRAQARYLRRHGVYHPVGRQLARVRCPSEQMKIARQQGESTVN